MRRQVRPRSRSGDHETLLAWLNARVNYERTPAAGNTPAAFGLDRMRRLLAALGNPHLRVAAVHVAGTKGKGSTVSMLAAILEESGLRVGRYLSPHVYRLEERIAVDGVPISRQALSAALARVIPAVESMDRSAARQGRPGPTWFEVMTAVAFVHFAEKGVDISVLETGLGGRLDATNVCRPLVTVITSISYDHMKLLGRTLTQIATEKAGIIKHGCPVVSGVSQPSARRAIEMVARRRRAPLLERGSDFAVHVQERRDPEALLKTVFELKSLDSIPRTFTIPLAGRHQAENAALAVVAADRLRILGITVTDEAVIRGLARAKLPARIETIAKRPLVIVDAAHNVASMTALANTLRPALTAHSGRVLVFAASNDKQIEKMLCSVHGLFDRVVITRYRRNPRAASLDRLRAGCLTAGLPTPAQADDPQEALQIARSLAGSRGVVVVAGSFFLAAEIGRARR